LLRSRCICWQIPERAGPAASEQSHKQLVFERKDLQIPLGQAQVDIAQFIPLILAGNDIVPSFNTRLLQRKYDVSAEVTIEVGGKPSTRPFCSKIPLLFFPDLPPQVVHVLLFQH